MLATPPLGAVLAVRLDVVIRPSLVAALVLAVAVGWFLWASRHGGPVLVVRRAVIRHRWPAVARSAGLARYVPRRSLWPTEAAGNPAHRVERIPTLRHPRSVVTADVRAALYEVRPARGGTLDDVAAASEALAAGLGVVAVNVTRHDARRGSLLAVVSR